MASDHILKRVDEELERLNATTNEMGGLTESQFAKAVADADVAKAYSVWQRDEEIDQVYTGPFRELLTYMMEDPRTTTACTHLLFMPKNIERAGDHVTNIAELVSFRSTGQNFAEARRKGSGALYTTDASS